MELDLQAIPDDDAKEFTFDLSAPPPAVPTDIPPLPGVDMSDDKAVSPEIVHPLTFADTQMASPVMIGTYDSWCGKVTKVYDDDADSEWGEKGVVEVRRSAPYWSGSTLGLDELPPAESQPQRATEHAFPLPVPDQQSYRVATGDPVVVIAGRDGKCYYISDDRPFVGVVAQNPDDASTKETNFGGAGNITIKVTRQFMTGDPTDGVPTLANISTLTYDYVYPLTATGQHHGHRKGDYVLCFRRGEYVFCLPNRGVYHGKITTTGPASEADLTDDQYWVSLVAGNVTYTGDVNVWTWGTDATLFTVCASNLAERADGTHTAATGTEVIVTLFADATDKAAYWAFSSNQVSLCENSTYSPIGDGEDFTALTSGRDATGTPSDAADYWVKGEMYQDASTPTKYNPWFMLDFSVIVCQQGTYSPWDSNHLPAGTDITMAASESYSLYVEGFMAPDDSSPTKWNPWFVLDPTKILDGDETWIHTANQAGGDGKLTVSHIGPNHSDGTKICSMSTGTYDSVDFCWVRHDSRGHLEAYQQGSTWYDYPSGDESTDQDGGAS